MASVVGPLQPRGCRASIWPLSAGKRPPNQAGDKVVPIQAALGYGLTGVARHADCGRSTLRSSWVPLGRCGVQIGRPHRDCWPSCAPVARPVSWRAYWSGVLGAVAGRASPIVGSLASRAASALRRDAMATPKSACFEGAVGGQASKTQGARLCRALLSPIHRRACPWAGRGGRQIVSLGRASLAHSYSFRNHPGES